MARSSVAAGRPMSPTDLALGYAGGLAAQVLKEPRVRREIRKWKRTFGF